MYVITEGNGRDVQIFTEGETYSHQWRCIVEDKYLLNSSREAWILFYQISLKLIIVAP